MEIRAEKKNLNLTNEASNNIERVEILSLVNDINTSEMENQHLKKLTEMTKNMSDEEQLAVAKGLRINALALENALRLINLGYDKKKLINVVKAMGDD